MPSMIPTRMQQHTMHACTQLCSLHADESETVADETVGRTVAFRGPASARRDGSTAAPSAIRRIGQRAATVASRCQRPCSPQTPRPPRPPRRLTAAHGFGRGGRPSRTRSIRLGARRWNGCGGGSRSLRRRASSACARTWRRPARATAPPGAHDKRRMPPPPAQPGPAPMRPPARPSWPSACPPAHRQRAAPARVRALHAVALPPSHTCDCVPDATHGRRAHSARQRAIGVHEGGATELPRAGAEHGQPREPAHAAEHSPRTHARAPSPHRQRCRHG